MFSTALIVFREALEAALIIGIVLAASRGIARRGLIAGTGAALGVAGALLIAALTGVIANAASGIGQEVLSAAILASAVIMLGWHNIWMARHASAMTAQLKSMGSAVVRGVLPVWMLGGVIAVAVLREGAEIVLFLYSIVLSGNHQHMLLGGVAGLLAGIAVGTLVYFGMLQIPLKHFFAATGALILLLSAGLAAQCAGILVQAGLLPTVGEQLWDTSGVINDHSIAGQLLHAALGYVSRPSGMQIIFYFLTLYATAALMLWARPRSTAAHTAAAVLIGMIGLAAFTPAPVKAAPFTVYSPRVVKGETEVEYRGFYERDNHSDINTNQQHSISVAYGFTNFWLSELYAVYQRAPGESLQSNGWEWENRFQLGEPGQYWVDFGLLVEYAHPSREHLTEIAVAPIIEKTMGAWVATGNVFFERQSGDAATSGTVLAYAARLKYLLHPKFEPALETFGEPGVISDMGRFNAQEHWLGPAFYGQLKTGNASKLEYSAALLTGTTGAASDWRMVLRMEYEFH